MGGGPRADVRGRRVALQPAQRPAPVQQLTTGQRRLRRQRRQRQAPERSRVVEERQALLAQVGPEAVLERFATEAVARRAYRALAALQAQAQGFAVVAGRTDRQWLASPLGQLAQRRRHRQVQAQAGLAARHGQHLEGHFGDHPEATEAARQQPRQVVAGDVLHHLAAEAQVGAQATDQPRAEDEIAYRSRPGPARSGQAAGEHPADGRPAAETRRLAGKHLPAPRQHGL